MMRQLKLLIRNWLRWLHRQTGTLSVLPIASQELQLARLEPRRVLSVNAVLAAGVLDISVQDDGGNTEASLISDTAGEYFVDADGDRIYDDGTTGPAELRGLIADLEHLRFQGDGGVGSFVWIGDFRGSGLQSFSAQDGESVTLQAQSTVEGDTRILASDRIVFDGDTQIRGDLRAEAPNIFNRSGSSLQVRDHAEFQSSQLELGNQSGDNLHFGTLRLDTVGNAEVHEDSGTNLVGSNNVTNLNLQSLGTLQVELGANLTIQSTGTLEATGPVGSIEIFGDVYSQGTVNANADQSIRMGSSASLQSDASASFLSTGDFAMSDGSSLIVETGDLTIESRADAFLSQITHNGSSSDSLRISAAGSVLDGSAAETPNIDATAASVHLVAQTGTLGTSADDLDLAIASLQFSAPGIVHLANDQALSLDGPSSAGGGLLLSNQGEIFIAADLNLRGDSELTALNSASASDSITIAQTTTVSLGTGSAATLSLNAGDDITIRGNIAAPGARVQLRANLDANNIGAGDGDVGEIFGDSPVSVLANRLDADAASISLTTDLQRLSARATTGDVEILDAGDLNLLSALSLEGHVDVMTAGDLLVVHAEASQGSVQVIAGGDLNTRRIVAETEVLAQSGGDLSIEGSGIRSALGNIRLVSFNDLLVDSQIHLQTSGNVDLAADDDITFSTLASVEIGGNGNITVSAGNQNQDAGPDAFDGIRARGLLATTGSIRLSTQNDGHIGLGGVTDAGPAGHIELHSAGWIDEIASAPQAGTSHQNLLADSLSASSQLHTHLQNVSVNRILMLEAGSASVLDGPWQIPNADAVDRGDDFLEELGAERLSAAENNDVLVAHDPNTDQSREAGVRETLEDVRRRYRFDDAFEHQYAIYLVNDRSLSVESAIASNHNDLATAASGPHIYLETLNADLRIDQASTFSQTTEEGGIVLVAGKDLTLGGPLVTTATLSPTELRTQTLHTVGDEVVERDTGEFDVAYLNATKFDGGEGVPPGDFLQTTTEFVIRDQFFGISAAAEDYRTHVFQRVLLQFGFDGEAGFHSFVGYFDGEVQVFSDSGDAGVLTKSINQLDPSDNASIDAAVSGTSDSVAFTRAISFENSFIDANQKLPTTAVIRRADDFFLFQNAEAPASEIQDLTFESFEIRDVVTLGAQGATELPTDPPQVLPPPVLGGIPSLPDTVIGGLTQSEIELSIPQEKEVEVTIYRVFYDDQNANGRADGLELPDAGQILEQEVVQSDAGAELQSGQRVRVESLNTTTGGSPSAEDLSRAKDQLLVDPTLPSGAYAIIERGIDDEEVVLDVFSLEDTAPGQRPLSEPAGPEEFKDTPLFVPSSEGALPEEVPPQKNQEELEPAIESRLEPGTLERSSASAAPFVPSAEGIPKSTTPNLPSFSERLLAAGLLVAAPRMGTSQRKEGNAQSPNEGQGFDRAARRQRRRNRRLA